MRYVLSRMAGVLVAILCACPASAQELPLSRTQRNWLDQHPTITVGIYEGGWLPFEEWNSGSPRGLALDYLSEFTARLGLNTQFRSFSSWGELMRSACDGEVDVIMNVAITAERTECLVFSRQYVETPIAVVARLQDSRAVASTELQGLRVITERDFATEAASELRYPNAIHVHADTTQQALQAVMDGHADVYLGNSYVAAHLIGTKGFIGLGLVRATSLPVNALHFAVPNDNRPLVEAINSALLSIPESRRDAIDLKWLPELRWQSEKGSLLTAVELAALKNVLRLGFPPKAPPLSFSDKQGQPMGLAAEYLRRFQQLGARLTPVPAGSWQEVRASMKNNKVDVAIAAVDSLGPGGDWVYSQPFVTIPNVIVISSDSKESVIGLRDLSGKIISLSDPERLGPSIAKSVRGVTFMPANDAERGLELVRQRKAHAYVGNLAVVDALIRDRFIGELRVSAPAGIEDRLALAAHKSHAPVVTAFDRMLASMSPREREAIRGDWLSFEYSRDVNWTQVIRWALPILATLIAILLLQARSYRRLRAEVDERKRLETRFAEVTGNLPAVIYQVTRAKSGELSFPLVVGDLQALFGITAEDAMAAGTALGERIHPDDRLKVRRAIEKAALARSELDIEFRALSDRGWRWVRSTSLPYASGRGSWHWTGYWIDVTDQHGQRDDLMAAKAAAEEAAKAKATFLATMSHEIRTPMSGVIGLLEMLSHTPLDNEQRKVVDTIEDSAQMLRQILDDILDFSRMEAGALVLESRPLNLRHIVDSVFQMLAPLSAAKGLRIDSRFDFRIADHHLGDGVRLRQILFNLVSNAIKFTERGRIRVSVVLDVVRDQRQSIRLLVSDTGVGIPEDRQERLFKPFSQAETSTTRQYGGTGLGLSICQRIVALMEGEISLRSKVGKGTTVTVALDLPVADATAYPDDGDKRLNAGTHLSPPRWKARILIAEDHPTNRLVMSWYMRQLALDFDIVANGAEALVALKKVNYDLLITDCLMPVMDGYALAEEVRRREKRTRAQRLPILAITANVYKGEADRCIAAGMDAYIAKPVSLGALSAALGRWLREQVGESAALEANHASGDDFAEHNGSPGILDDVAKRYGSLVTATAMLRSLADTARSDTDLIKKFLAGDQEVDVAEVLHRLAGGLGVVVRDTMAEEAKTLSIRYASGGSIPEASELEEFTAKIDALVVEIDHSVHD